MELGAGLLFLCYQRDPRTGFIKLFEKMSKFDMMNQFVTHTGGGLFACPCGVVRLQMSDLPPPSPEKDTLAQLPPAGRGRLNKVWSPKVLTFSSLKVVGISGVQLGPGAAALADTPYYLEVRGVAH